jgi:hypothetical protein
MAKFYDPNGSALGYYSVPLKKGRHEVFLVTIKSTTVGGVNGVIYLFTK